MVKNRAGLMESKKGWLKAVEVTMAIFIILGFVTYLAFDKSQNASSISKKNDFSNIIPPFLESLAKDATLRDSLWDSDELKTHEDISKLLEPLSIKNGFDFYLVLTQASSQVPLNPSNEVASKGKDVYYYERFVFSDSSSPSSNLEAKKVAIFVWRK